MPNLSALRAAFPVPPQPEEGFLADLRDSLQAKRERLLQRPLIAEIVGAAPDTASPEAQDDSIFGFLSSHLQRAAPRRSAVWQEGEDGTARLRIAIDYDDLWRGLEREVLSGVRDSVEGAVTLLTSAQQRLLLASPREFLDLQPRPQEVELVDFVVERIGGSERVVELVLAEVPPGKEHLTHVAIVPNLVPLQRQLDALEWLRSAAPEGPLAPLRALTGLQPGHMLPASAGACAVPPRARLDEFQRDCVQKALTTPHFALIQGPPGSGKTTVISAIVEGALAQGQRVMVVSPTHVAVDNVVEKLAAEVAPGKDTLPPWSLPVRYSARRSRLLPVAQRYWVGPSEEVRGATVGRRLEQALRARSPVADALFDCVDRERSGHAALSRALAQESTVVCGTPIGILSCPSIKEAGPGEIDLLVVDEVSKMTLPEFLAVAVKARRWVLVGDPEQLPPYNDVEENGVTIDALLSGELELVCSVSALVERCHPADRPNLRLVVVAQEPDRVAETIIDQLKAVDMVSAPRVVVVGEGQRGGIVVCAPDEAEQVAQALSPVHQQHRGYSPQREGSVRLLVERGVSIPRPEVASGLRLVEPRERAGAEIFDKCFGVFHAQPWAWRAQQGLRVVSFRNGLPKILPSRAALEACGPPGWTLPALIEAIAARYALNVVSVFDWLAGFAEARFDTSPMTELSAALRPVEGLRAAVEPYVGTLRKQYRMHSSISRVPRELFYFGEALFDGRSSDEACRIRHIQVTRQGPSGEDNAEEAEEIVQCLAQFSAFGLQRRAPHTVLVITPYRAQEALLGRAIAQAQEEGKLGGVEIELCTLDRCQGREADMVFISLVRSRASVFMDSPKRWNVALTRAQNGLFIFGDVEAFLQEADKARREAQRSGGKPRMSMLARILESQARQMQHKTPVVVGVMS